MLTEQDCILLAQAIRGEFNRVWPANSVVRTVFTIVTEDRTSANPYNFKGAIAVSLTNLGTNSVSIDSISILSGRGETITVTAPFQNTEMIDSHTIEFSGAGTSQLLVVSQFLVPKN